MGLGIGKITDATDAMWFSSSQPSQAACALQLDLVNVMSYDAGEVSTTGYDPQVAYDAYRSLFTGDIAMGVEVANEAWGGHVVSLEKVQRWSQYFKANGGNGMMLWVSERH